MAMPHTLGTTNKITPDTPDLAGNPTWQIEQRKVNFSHDSSGIEFSMQPSKGSIVNTKSDG